MLAKLPKKLQTKENWSDLDGYNKKMEQLWWTTEGKHASTVIYD